MQNCYIFLDKESENKQVPNITLEGYTSVKESFGFVAFDWDGTNTVMYNLRNIFALRFFITEDVADDISNDHF